MKKLITLVLVLAMLVTLAGCCTKHEFRAATCTEPKTCSKCGETEGEALGHAAGDWQVTALDLAKAEAKKVQICEFCDEELDSKTEQLKSFVSDETGMFLFNAEEFAEHVADIVKEYSYFEIHVELREDSDDGSAQLVILNKNDAEMAWIWFYNDSELIDIDETDAKTIDGIRLCVPFLDGLDEDVVWALFFDMADVMNMAVDPTVTEYGENGDDVTGNVYYLNDEDEESEALNGLYYSCFMGNENKSIIMDVDIEK